VRLSRQGLFDSIRRTEAWLLPPECLQCRAPITEQVELPVCQLCRNRWRSPSEPICRRCGSQELSGVSCRVCRQWPQDLVTIQSAVMLDVNVRGLIHNFKYNGWSRLADSMAEPMARIISRRIKARLVPIPTTRRRLRLRGYNQAGLLAAAISRRLHINVESEALSRVREDASQTKFGAQDRLANLAGAFRASRVSGHLILVDDVFTTGATLVSAATALLAAGATTVSAVTFARADQPLAKAARLLTTDISTSERD
jgi:ComF family protein